MMTAILFSVAVAALGLALWNALRLRKLTKALKHTMRQLDVLDKDLRG